MKKQVLVVCTYNSVRSQMAEGLFRHLAGGRYDIFSAGVFKTGQNPLAVDVMRELGVDISGQPSKSIETYRDRRFDYIMMFSPEAREACKEAFPDSPRLYWPEKDPNLVQGERDVRLKAFRTVRDNIKRRIEGFLAAQSE